MNVVSPLSGFYYFHNFVQWFEESCANVNPYFQSGKGEGVSSAIVLSKNQKFAIFTKPNYQGLQQQLEPDTRYATPDAMKFPNDRLQSLRKKWDDQPYLALRLHFVPPFFSFLFVFCFVHLFF